MKNKTNKLVKRGMWCALIIFVVRCLISIEAIRNGLSAYLVWSFVGEAMGLSALIMVAYEKWLWKYDPFLKEPNISGSYSGTIESSFDAQKRKAMLTIKQTFLSVDVTLQTLESTSRAISGYIDDFAGKKELVYTYLNEPKSKIRDRSEIHFGTASFILDGSDCLVGKYYTDRKTIGDMVFRKESTKKAKKIKKGGSERK